MHSAAQFQLNSSSNSSTYSSACLSPKQLRLSAHGIELTFFGILMPPIILFGLIGNYLTLFVLLNRHTKTRSDILLAMLALLDVLFLLLMFPNSLAHFDFFIHSHLFRLIYFAIKVHLLALINQCSAAAIWIMLGICLERFIGITRPFTSRISHRRSSGTFLFIGIAILGSFILTFYIHLSYRCIIRSFCNGTQIYSFCFQIDSKQLLNLSQANSKTLPSASLLAYVHYSPIIHAFLVIFLPTLVIIFSNFALIWTLHKRDHYLALARADSSDTTTESGSTKTGGHSRGLIQNARIEHRVTITVAIVTSFTLTQTPSAIVQLLFSSQIDSKNPHLTLRAITIFLVVFGKSFNFILFCLSSHNFRSTLRQLINSKIFQKPWSFHNQRSY